MISNLTYSNLNAINNATANVTTCEVCRKLESLNLQPKPKGQIAISWSGVIPIPKPNTWNNRWLKLPPKVDWFASTPPVWYPLAKPITRPWTSKPRTSPLVIQHKSHYKAKAHKQEHQIKYKLNHKTCKY